MACYRNGGCGPYEGRPCNECPASKPEYAMRSVNFAHSNPHEGAKTAIKIKVFLNEDGISCVMKDTYLPIEIELIDEVAVQHSAQYCDDPDANGDEWVDAYINQLCGDGFLYVEEEKIVVTNDL
jgi:hypothetical protein